MLLAVNVVLVALLAITHWDRFCQLVRGLYNLGSQWVTTSTVLGFYGLLILYLFIIVHAPSTTKIPHRKRRSKRLAPYYDHTGKLIGWVREEDEEFTTQTPHDDTLVPQLSPGILPTRNLKTSPSTVTPATRIRHAPSTATGVNRSAMVIITQMKFNPENGEVDWHDPEFKFTCFPCRPRTTAKLLVPKQTVMLPDPRAKDQWRDDGVLWYPALFIKRHPYASNKKREYEFRFYESIDWAMEDDEYWPPDRHFHTDLVFCEEVLKIVLRPEQMGMIRAPAEWTDCPSEDHPLVKIFDAAINPLATVLRTFPDDHPVILAYTTFFEDEPDEARETRLEDWPALRRLVDPLPELIALMERPLQRLEDFRVLSVPGQQERHYRVIGVGRAMLQILALQHELGEPLDLSGATFEELVDNAITAVPVEAIGALYHMFLATKPRVLHHKKYWSLDAFKQATTNFATIHSMRDPEYHPQLYRRKPGTPLESRRPRIPVEFPTDDTSEGHPKKMKTEIRRRKTRPRPEEDEDDMPAPKRQAKQQRNQGKRPLEQKKAPAVASVGERVARRQRSDDEEEDLPVPKRQTTQQRQLRSREKKPAAGKKAPAAPTGKVVAQGKGWYEVESGSDNEDSE
ncbi:hypothetical protein C8R47DRAFT_1204081 [Mycena vitilis]|nr:hypothetical protein C8R47DRAFT_1204081 [Mycena vitilis]